MRHTVKPSGIGVKNNSQFSISHSQRLAQRRAASWHEPLKLRAYAGEACLQAGQWQALDIPPQTRRFEQGEIMSNLDSAYGLTVWRFLNA
jgi:hypothetical protein